MKYYTVFVFILTKDCLDIMFLHDSQIIYLYSGLSSDGILIQVGVCHDQCNIESKS